MAKALTAKQQRFVDAYAGNATEAARLAGYTGSDAVLAVTGHDLLRNPKIAPLIAARESRLLKKLIASRERRQEFWTEVLQDRGEEMGARLKASELLGRSEADFTEKVDGTLAMTVSVAINGIKAGGK